MAQKKAQQKKGRQSQRGDAEQKQAAQAKREARRARNERAKAAAAARRKAEQRKQRLIAAGVVLAVIAVVVGGLFLVRALDDSAETSAPPAGASDDFGLVVGEDGAPTSVVIYEDFLCPSCAALEQAVDEQLATAAEEGRASVEYRPVAILTQFGDYSVEAANAFAVVLDEAGPEVAKEFHDLLYADQPPESGPLPGTDWLVEKAIEAGAEEAAVRPGIEEIAFEGWVENATGAFEDAGYRGTPTVLVDGEPVPGETIAEVAQGISDAVGG